MDKGKQGREHMNIKELARVLKVVNELRLLGKRLHYFLALKEAGRPVDPSRIDTMKAYGAELASQIGLVIEYSDGLRSSHIYLKNKDGNASMAIDYRKGAIYREAEADHGKR